MINILPLIVSVSAMLSVSMLVMSLFSTERMDMTPLRARDGAAKGKGTLQGAVLRQSRFSNIRVLNTLLSHTRLAKRLTQDLEQADIPLQVGEYILLRAVVAVLLAVLALMIVHNVVAAGIGAVAGYLLPAWHVSMAKKRRLNKLSKQLPEMLTIVSGSLKSGYGFLQSLEFAIQQMSPPMATELQRTVRDTTLGKTLDEAMAALLERVPTYEMDMVITAVTIQKSVGGNLSEILDNVGYTMRERERIDGEIQTLTSQQKLTGFILASLPIGVGGFFFLINREYITPLFTTGPGIAMLIGAIVLEIIGILIMRRILAIDI